MMAVLIEIADFAPYDVMCSECDAVFGVPDWIRSPGVELSYCPFCGNELEDEPDA